jgi:SPX domain protein involved in polyphosphate accumulation
MLESAHSVFHEMRDIDQLIAEATGEAHLFDFREERKYLVTQQTAQALRPVLGTRLALEQFVPGRTRSVVHSVYLDSPDFSLYRESLLEEDSLKLRLRTYANPDGHCDEWVFFECKLGVGEAAGKKKRKIRWALTPGMVSAFLAADYDQIVPGAHPKIWRKVVALLAARRAVPRLTVSYEREAFVSADGHLRITLDAGYHASRIEPGLHSRADAAHGYLPGIGILEVKLVGAFPGWLAELLAASGVSPEGQGFSKFKTAVPLLFSEFSKKEVADACT